MGRLLRARRQHRTVSHLSQSRDSKADVNPWGIASLDSTVQTQAGKLALRDAMRARFAPSSAGPQRDRSGGSNRYRSSPAGRRSGSVPRSSDLASQSSDIQGRKSIGAAIRDHDSPRRTRRRRGQPELSDHEGHKPAAAPRPSRRQRQKIRRPPLVEVQTAKAPKLPNPKDPQVNLRFSASPPQVFVRYHTRSGYFGDYQSYLSKNVLFLQNTEETPKKGSVMQINIFLPSGLSVQCEGVVIATLPNGFGLNLQLNAEARMTLASASRI